MADSIPEEWLNGFNVGWMKGVRQALELSKRDKSNIIREVREKFEKHIAHLEAIIQKQLESHERDEGITYFSYEKPSNDWRQHERQK